jgi:hypothetical protein
MPCNSTLVAGCDLNSAGHFHAKQSFLQLESYQLQINMSNFFFLLRSVLDYSSPWKGEGWGKGAEKEEPAPLQLLTQGNDSDKSNYPLPALLLSRQKLTEMV